MQQPPGTLALSALPESIVGLFRRSFLTVSAEDRPKPREWVEPLEKLAESLKKCSLHSGHFYYQQLTDCPWCEIESRARVRLFNFMLAGANGTRSRFHLDEIWREIESVEPPVVLLNPQNIQPKGPVASCEALYFAKDRENRFLIAIPVAVGVGFMLPWMANPTMTFMLLVIAGFMLYRYAKAGLKGAGQMQMNIQGRPSIPYGLFVRKIESAKLQAEDAVHQIEEK